MGDNVRMIPGIEPISRLQRLMEEWADWYHGYRSRLGFDPKCSVIGGSGSDDFDSLLHKVEAQVCQIIDTAVNDLPAIQGAAVHHRYLHSVYRFRDYAGTLDVAHERLLIVLPIKGVVI